MKTASISVAMLLAGETSFASSRICSSADQALSYAEHWADGGASIERSITVQVNGVAVYKRSPLVNDVDEASFSFVGPSTPLQTTSSEHGDISTYGQLLLVSLHPSDGSAPSEIQDWVICRFVNTPCPLCP